MTVNPRHRNVRKESIKVVGFTDRERLFATRGSSDFVTCPAERKGQEVEDRDLIVYDEDPRHANTSLTHCAGKHNTTQQAIHAAEYHIRFLFTGGLGLSHDIIRHLVLP